MFSYNSVFWCSLWIELLATCLPSDNKYIHRQIRPVEKPLLSTSCSSG